MVQQASTVCATRVWKNKKRTDMATIKIGKFGGEVPRLADHLLDPSQAQLAQNVKVVSGALRAWKKPATVFSPVRANVKSFYRMLHTDGTERWLTFIEDVNVVPGAVANDSDTRVYYTGQATPRKTNYALATNNGTVTECPFDYLELGVPAPSAAPTLAVVGGSGTTTTRSYVYTFLTSWGEESTPSLPVTVTGFANGSWNLSALQTTIAGKYSVTKQRIYRTLTGSDGVTNYQLVVEQNVATTYSDTKLDTALGSIIESSDYDVPPTDLTNLITLPNGVMAGFSPSTRQICFCEPFRPHAWPAEYRYAIEYKPVAIAANGSSVLVATQGAPYIFTGAHPSTMQAVKLPSVEPGVAKLAIADVGVGVVYGTQNGFVLSSAAGASMASKDFFSRDEWQELLPSSMKFCKYDEKLFIFYRYINAQAEAVYGGYILDRNMGVLASTNVIADYVYVDAINAKMYLLQDNEIMEWDGDSYQWLSYTWRSKRFIMQRPVNMGVAQVDADFAAVSDTSNAAAALAAQKADNQTIFAANANLAGAFNENMFHETNESLGVGYTFNGSLMYDLQENVIDQFVTFKLYTNGVLKHTKSVSSREPFRLPSGYRSDAYEVEIAASVDVNYIKVAETADELRRL